jgi:hypothetical protein
MQDVEVGDPEFDEAFIIKGDDEIRVRDLFANPKIRQLILAHPKIRLTVKDSEGWFGPKFPTTWMNFISRSSASSRTWTG